MADFNVKVLPNGPLIAVGPMVITDPTGVDIAVPESETVALCRCGLSSEKPFCTGAHRDGGFQAAEAISRTFGS